MSEREELAKRFYGLPITDGERLLVAREVMRFAAEELEGCLVDDGVTTKLRVKARLAALRGQEEPMDPETVTVRKSDLAAIMRHYEQLAGKPPKYECPHSNVAAALSPPKCEHKNPSIRGWGIDGCMHCPDCGATAPAVPGEWSGP